MRKGLLAVLFLLALPIAAWANGIDITNKFGTISISQAGITSHGAELYSYNRIIAPHGHSLGSVSYTIGPLTSGSILSGGTFSSAGSSFEVVGTGNHGQPKGVIFDGAFVGNITWTFLGKTGGFLKYQLTGTVTGQLYNGRYVTATTTQTYWATTAQLSQGIAHGILGTTGFMNTPEPNTLGLLGSGLLGLAGLIRYRAKHP